MLYACDSQWWNVHHKAVVESDFEGELWTQDYHAATRHKINRMGSENKPGLGVHDVIHQGGNSGYQAINLAYLWGAKAIVLLGFDCSPAKDGKAHWFGQHGPGLTRQQPFSLWQAHFPQLAEDLKAQGVPVYNASRETALRCFDRVSLESLIGGQLCSQL